jgi:hypothetical protein
MGVSPGIGLRRHSRPRRRTLSQGLFRRDFNCQLAKQTFFAQVQHYKFMIWGFVCNLLFGAQNGQEICDKTNATV